MTTIPMSLISSVPTTPSLNVNTTLMLTNSPSLIPPISNEINIPIKTEEFSTDITTLDDSIIMSTQLNSETGMEIETNMIPLENQVIQSTQVLLNSENIENKPKNKRKRKPGTSTPRVTLHSPLDPHTGWVAECHKCGKIGKFRHNFEGRSFQHSTGNGKYCGYFRVNPRKIEDVVESQTLNSFHHGVDESLQTLHSPSSSSSLSQLSQLSPTTLTTTTTTTTTAATTIPTKPTTPLTSSE